MTNNAAIVYVFIDDADKAVSMEDIKEWLQILNDVLEMKLQFDAATKRPCYYVQFRNAAAAQQAVQYLNGARFKNCVVTIQSHVYTALPATSTEADNTTGDLLTGPTEALQTRESCRETTELPFNHLMPPDLQMDSALAVCLPDLEKTTDYAVDGPPMWQKLQDVQKELVEIYRELENTTAQVSAADARLTQLLQVKGSSPPIGDSAKLFSTAALYERQSALQAHHCLSHQRVIPYDAHTPSRVIALLTDSFGPLSLYSETVTQNGFFLAVRFLFAADEERFLKASSASVSSAATEVSSARQGTEWTSIVEQLGWTPRERTFPVHEMFSLTIDKQVQRAVRELLV